MERMMNYILCGLAIYGFIGLVIYIVGYISGEVQKAALEVCYEHKDPRVKLIIILMLPVAIIIWPSLISFGKKSGSRYSDEELKEFEDLIEDDWRK